jgi:leader peptidase (prepilin peptidase)/N-methyltransferase
MIRILGTIFAALLGLAFGSFLNVCLSRWPEGESIVQPHSHCRHCSRTLAWWENVPIFSWLALRGRCRNCRTWIGWRYPLVELSVGALWAVRIARWMPELLDPRLPSPVVYYDLAIAIAALLLLWFLVALAVLDAENLWLPDWITLPGTVLGFAFTLLKLELLVKLASLTGLPFTHGLENERYGLYGIALKCLLGILVAAALILLIRWVYWLFRRREGIGLGDAKLMALLAAWLGLPGALLAFGLGAVLGALVAVILLAIPAAPTNTNPWALKKLPLGTFLCIGGIVSALWGQPIVAAYLHWSGF